MLLLCPQRPFAFAGTPFIGLGIKDPQKNPQNRGQRRLFLPDGVTTLPFPEESAKPRLRLQIWLRRAFCGQRLRMQQCNDSRLQPSFGEHVCNLKGCSRDTLQCCILQASMLQHQWFPLLRVRMPGILFFAAFTVRAPIPRSWAFLKISSLGTSSPSARSSRIRSSAVATLDSVDTPHSRPSADISSYHPASGIPLHLPDRMPETYHWEPGRIYRVP